MNLFVTEISWVPPVLGDHLVTPGCMFSDPALMSLCTINLNPQPEPEPLVNDPVAAQ